MEKKKILQGSSITCLKFRKKKLGNILELYTIVKQNMKMEK